MEITLTAPRSFSLAAVVNSHGWVQLAPFARQAEGDGCTYVMRLSSGRVVELVLTAKADAVLVDINGHIGDSEQTEITGAVIWMLGLNQEFDDFYQLARGEPGLAKMAERAQGRLLRSGSLFEDMVKTILTTNTAWSGTIRMAGALVDNFGDPIPTDPARHAFPTPERLADAGEAALRQVAGLGYRAPYVHRLACDVSAGSLDLEAMRDASLDTADLRKQLLALKGIGNYAAAHMLMILGRYDRLPIDSWALKLVSAEWHKGAPIGPAEVEAAFARWGDWRGLAYWFWDWAHTDTA